MNNDASWQDILLAARNNFAGTVDETPAQEMPQEEKNTSTLDIILEKKGRGGKVATIVTGFTISDDKVKDIASKMKTKLGTGGSARGGEILIQGDRRKDILEYLKATGFKARII